MKSNAIIDYTAEISEAINLQREYVSKDFRMGSKAFLLEILFKYSGKIILCISLIALIGLGIGISIDVRYLILSLMIVFLIIPMVIAFAYYYWGFKPGFYCNTVPHQLVISDSGIKFKLFFRSLESDENNKLLINSDEKSDKDEKVIIREESVNYSDLNPFVIGNKSILIPYKNKKEGFIWIPIDAYDNDSFITITKFLDEKIIK